jgi:hypothetical protein
VINELIELIRINRNIGNTFKVLEAAHVKDFLKELIEKKESDPNKVFAIVDVTVAFRDRFADVYMEDITKLAAK